MSWVLVISLCVWVLIKHREVIKYREKLDTIKHLLRQGKYEEAIKECWYDD